MAFDDLLRDYLYLDKPKIESFYNQLHPNITALAISSEQYSGAEVKSAIELPGILKAIVSPSISGKYEQSNGSDISVNVQATIEDKFEYLLSRAIGNDGESLRVSEISSDALITGDILCASIDTISDYTNNYLKSNGFESLDDFLVAYAQSTLSEQIWDGIVNIAKSQPARSYVTSSQRMEYTSIVAKNRRSENALARFLIVNSKYPIYLNFSYSKLTLSLSTATTFCFGKNLNNVTILGILHKLSSKMYSIKPLAMWKRLIYD